MVLKEMGESKWWREFTIGAVIVCIVLFYGAEFLGNHILAQAVGCPCCISLLLVVIVFIVPFVAKIVKKD